MQLLGLLLTATTLLALTSAQATVYLIRHGEKPADGGNGLTAQGQQRAQCLVNVIGKSSSYDIGYILAERPKSDGSRQRPYDTVKPLADSLGLKIDTSCGRDDSDCVANAVDSYEGQGGFIHTDCAELTRQEIFLSAGSMAN